MSWARYWATRASEALEGSDATPVAARSWLTRPNWTPAAPPTPETGGPGRTGAGRAATGAAGGAAAGAGVGGGVTRSAIRPSPLIPACNDPRVATCVVASGRVARERAGWVPTMLMVVSATSGTPTIRTTRITERDNSDSPLRSGLADFRTDGRPYPAIRRPRNGPPRLSNRRQCGYQAEAATKKRSWPSSWPGRMAI